MSESRGFRWAATSARLLAGTVVSAAAVIAAATAVTLPWPGLDREPVSISAVPAPAASVLACTGGLLALGRDPGDAGGITDAAGQAVVSGTSDGAADAVRTELLPESIDQGEGPAVFTADPDGGVRTDVAAAGSSTVRSDDLAGFAASACRPPLLESWLVGGAATTGAADLVILANPGTVPAAVQITVYGAEGGEVPAGGERIVVAPGTQRIVPLSGLALGEESPVLRVTATGAPVQASLQTSLTRVLVPVGADQTGPIAEPARLQEIEGVPVAADADVATVGTVLRMLSPSLDATATVSATAVGSTAAALVVQDVPLRAGVPTEVSLDDLAAGLYTLRVDADQPVVAGARQATGTEAGSDFAWYASAPVVDAASLFAIPSGAPATLVLTNPSDEVAEVVVASRSGAFERTVEVPAGGGASLRLSSGAVYVLDPAGAPVRAGISLSGDGAVAGYPVWPADAAARPIRVYP